jgi:citrate synthase
LTGKKPERLTESIRSSKGLDGVVVGETRIGKSGLAGTLIYRGYDILDLFDNASFEEAAYLVLYGQLPIEQELASFRSRLKENMEVPDGVFDLRRVLPRGAHPMDLLRIAVSSLGAFDGEGNAEDRQISLAAKMPALVANGYRLSRGLDPIKPSRAMSFAENLLYMVSGGRPDQFDAWVLERELILYLEHDLNASSFAVRVVASTRADVYAAVSAGLAALQGPLHGGANEEAIRLILSIGDPKRAKEHIGKMLADGKKIPGFGHRVYKKVDPRAQLSKKLLNRLIEQKGSDDNLYRLAIEVESAVWTSKSLPANIELYAGPVFNVLGLPIEVYTPLFASARVFGWMAHFNEQVAENKLIRPDTIYVGPTGLKYKPIRDR